MRADRASLLVAAAIALSACAASESPSTRQAGPIPRSSTPMNPDATVTSDPPVTSDPADSAPDMDDADDPVADESGIAAADRDGHWLSVRDGDLVDRDGDRVVLVGSTLYAFPFYLADNWADWPVMVESRRVVENLDPILDRMQELGHDTIRVPLGSAAWSEHVYSLSSSEWLDRLELIVDSAAERDIVVMITWWDSLEMHDEWPDRYEESYRFMRAVHERVGDRPNLVVEPMNEPNGIEWEEWVDATSATLTFWRDELGFEGPIVLDTIHWSWDFDPDAADELLRLDGELVDGTPNLLFAIHRYANGNSCFCDDERSSWDETVGRHVDEYPIIVTEVGNTNEGFPPQGDWVDGFVTHLVDDLVPSGLDGVLAFTWRWQDANSMTDWDGTTLTGFGDQIVELLDPLTESDRP